jgi:hypothetical protein
MGLNVVANDCTTFHQALIQHRRQNVDTHNIYSNLLK